MSETYFSIELYGSELATAITLLFDHDISLNVIKAIENNELDLFVRENRYGSVSGSHEAGNGVKLKKRLRTPVLGCVAVCLTCDEHGKWD